MRKQVHGFRGECEGGATSYVGFDDGKGGVFAPVMEVMIISEQNVPPTLIEKHTIINRRSNVVYRHQLFDVDLAQLFNTRDIEHRHYA